MGGWKTILLLKIFLFFYVHIRVCFAEQMSFSIINIHHFLFYQTHLTIRSVLFSIVVSLALDCPAGLRVWKCSSSPLSGGCISKVHPGQGSR